MLETRIDTLTTELVDTRVHLHNILSEIKSNNNEEILVKLADFREDCLELSKSNITDLTVVKTQLSKEIAQLKQSISTVKSTQQLSDTKLDMVSTDLTAHITSLKKEV